MATSTFKKDFRLANSKEADVFAEAMSTIGSPTLKKNFKYSYKSEKEVRDVLRKALSK